MLALEAGDQAGPRRRLDRMRRDAEQGPARRQRDPRDLARGRQGVRGRGRRLALPLPRRRGRAHPAGADAERDQRRRARAELDRPAGVHARPGRGAVVSRGAPDRLRGLPRAEGRAARARARDRPSATRAASRPTCRRARRRSRRSSRRPSGPVTATRRDRARSGDERGLSRRRLPLRGPRARLGRAERLLGRPDRRATRSSRSRTAPPRTTGTPGRSSRASSATACSSSATISSSPTPSGCERGIEAGVGNSILVKVNQIGTLTETLEAIRARAGRGLHRRHLAPLGRDRGHDDRRPRRRHERGPDQDGRPGPLGPRREVQPAAADRGGARRSRRVSGLVGLPAGSALTSWPRPTPR